ncbi:MAG: prepilin peptidase [Gemmatimonadales bacterium]
MPIEEALAGPALPLLAGALGLVVGSFLNVCIARWPKDESVVRPRSRCPGCQKPIAWYDNVPVLSWLLLRAHCRHCREPISIQYPMVELAVGVLWAWMAWRYGPTIEALRGATFVTILLGIAATDARHYLIPDEFTWGGLALGLLFSLAGGLEGFITALIGAAVGFVLLYVVGFLGTLAFKEEAMGGGDIKMMAMVGAFVGWQGVLLTIFLGALLGSLIFVPLALVGRKKLVPFGVFLAMGAVAAYLAGPALVAWYRDTFLFT